MKTRITRIAPMVLAAVLTLGLTACASDGGSTDSDTGTTGTATEGEVGGTDPLEGGTASETEG